MSSHGASVCIFLFFYLLLIITIHHRSTDLFPNKSLSMNLQILSFFRAECVSQSGTPQCITHERLMREVKSGCGAEIGRHYLVRVTKSRCVRLAY